MERSRESLLTCNHKEVVPRCLNVRASSPSTLHFADALEDYSFGTWLVNPFTNLTEAIDIV
jgi:hypothetical protein